MQQTARRAAAERVIVGRTARTSRVAQAVEVMVTNDAATSPAPQAGITTALTGDRQQPAPPGHGQAVSLAQLQLRVPAEFGGWQTQ
jgi:hypothetical protein